MKRISEARAGMSAEIERILIPPEQVHARVRELAREISRDYASLECPLLVCLLEGARMFFSELVSHLSIRVDQEFMAVRSYGNNVVSSGQVKTVMDLKTPIENRHVLLVEDIVDTGRTLSSVIRSLSEQCPASLKICSLLDKPSRRETPIRPDYRGFEVPDLFVVGYGLDFAGRYRDLPCVAVIHFV